MDTNEPTLEIVYKDINKKFEDPDVKIIIPKSKFRSILFTNMVVIEFDTDSYNIVFDAVVVAKDYTCYNLEPREIFITEGVKPTASDAAQFCAMLNRMLNEEEEAKEDIEAGTILLSYYIDRTIHDFYVKVSREYFTTYEKITTKEKNAPIASKKEIYTHWSRFSIPAGFHTDVKVHYSGISIDVKIYPNARDNHTKEGLFVSYIFHRDDFKGEPIVNDFFKVINAIDGSLGWNTDDMLQAHDAVANEIEQELRSKLNDDSVEVFVVHQIIIEVMRMRLMEWTSKQLNREGDDNGER